MHYHIWLPAIRYPDGHAMVQAIMQPTAYTWRTQAYRQRDRIVVQGGYEPSYVQVRSCEQEECAPGPAPAPARLTLNESRGE